MSEQALEEVVEETTLENDEVVEENDYSEIEQEAMSKGWNPEGVEGKRNLSAEEFLDRQPIYDELHKVRKKLKEQDKKFEAMQQHEKMVRDRMHEDHMKELKAAKRTAMEEMDYDKVEQLDDEMLKAKEEHSKADVVVSQAETPEHIQEVVEDWAVKNPWYENNKAMQRFALIEGQEYKAQNPSSPIEEVLDHVAKTVKKEFPEKFQNMNRQKPSSVEGSTTSGKRTKASEKQKTVRDLPEEAISVMKTLVRAGAFKTEQDYVNDYFNQ